MSEKENDFKSTFSYKLIYIFSITNDHAHDGCLKIGDATIHTDKTYDQLPINCSDLRSAAKERINQYTNTAGISYNLLHAEIAVYINKDKQSKNYGKLLAFRDYQVHEVLKRSGIKVHYFDTSKKQNEWFECDLETAKNAIKAVKENHTSLNPGTITTGINPIVFRPEQEEAIKDAIKAFKHGYQFLWNAKMRFGKTLSALEVIKREGFKRSIIITHRPVVDDGWYKDFDKIFFNMPEYRYGSRDNGDKLENLLSSGKPFVFFKSIQDLRGSNAVGGKFDKNDEIFKTDWDFLIIDEAHEGTQTKLGKAVKAALIKQNTKILDLSGTPFNIFNKFKPEDIYTWDYMMEQEAKNNWALTHFGDSNPYEDLPTMNIFTYHLDKIFRSYTDVMDKAFKFSEFFRVWTGDVEKDQAHMPTGAKVGDFVHEKDVKAFLDLICQKSDESNYPFSTEKYRDYFRHTLWVVPGVKEAKALTILLRMHPVFGNFSSIVNVAGKGDEEIEANDALQAVRNAITDNPEKTRTITVSCGRLTTGVTVPEWTAVFMLAGTYSTSASQYMQTIFRVQSPANINGKMKDNCYVFDFAPDRTLKMIVDSAFFSQRTKNKNITKAECMAKFLNYCPVISIEGSQMKKYKVSELLQELRKAYIERVQRNGFDDTRIYNNELLLKLTGKNLDDFSELKAIIGVSKQVKKVQDIDINNEGFSDEEYEKMRELENIPKSELTEEQKKLKEEYNERKRNRQSAISILRGISIRIPLLIYGMDKDIDTNFSIDDLTTIVNDSSWEEFMPKGVTKALFKKFTQYYDKDIFIGAAMRVRSISKNADELEPEERIKEITNLFTTFKNPDKETVLTPWRVVNMHLSETIGGYCFYDENFENELDSPRYVDQGQVTKEVFGDDSKVLEINSKTGLYPLFLTYTFYRRLLEKNGKKEMTLKEKQVLWDNILEKNIYTICKTDMAKLIAKRTLLGYRDGKLNSHAFQDLIMQMKDKQNQLIKKIKDPNFWGKKEEGEMKFNAIVGNPPYQIMDGGAKASAQPVYHYFISFAKELKPDFFSLITPSRWFTGGKGLDDFRENMLKDSHFKKIIDHPNSNDCFETVDIKGGINYFLWEKNWNGPCDIKVLNGQKIVSESQRPLLEPGCDVFIRNNSLVSIFNKVCKNNFTPFSSIISPLKPYGLRGDIFKDTQKYGLPPMSITPIKDGITIFGLDDKLKRVKMYVPNNYPFPKKEYIHGIKIFMSRNLGSGIFGEAFPLPIFAMDNEACTETYVVIGPFKNNLEMVNCWRYICSKFFRTMLSIKKNDQGASSSTYKYVPLQDFSEKSDIDFKGSLENLDDSLFKKYNLSNDEMNYIKSNVKSMSSEDILGIKNEDDANCFYIKKGQEILAKGKFENGKFIVLKGSKCLPESDNFSEGKYKLQKEKINTQKVIVNNCFTKDFIFSSPSSASSIILGRCSNGTMDWKNCFGDSFKNF